MDLTPNSPTPWWSLIRCCRPSPTSPGGAETLEQTACHITDDATHSASGLGFFDKMDDFKGSIKDAAGDLKASIKDAAGDVIEFIDDKIDVPVLIGASQISCVSTLAPLLRIP